MNTTTLLIIALFVGVTILGVVLRIILNKVYDKARNKHVRNSNAKNPPAKTKLSDMYDNHSKK